MNELILHGSVGASFWGEDFFTVATVRAQLAGMTGPLTVRINSGGGIATEGQAIFVMLRDYAASKGPVETVADAVAASAASLIFMAGDRRTLRTGAYLVIHDPAQPFTETRGTEEDHRRLAEQLRVKSEAYAEVYANRAGLSRDEARQIMREDTVLEGEAAVLLGFATSVEDAEAETPALYDYAVYANAPPALLAVAMALTKPKDNPMDDNLDPAAVEAVDQEIIAGELAAEDETLAADPVVEVETPAPELVVAQAAPVTAIDTAAITARERTRTTRIMSAAITAGVSMTIATALIESGADEATALESILNSRKELSMSTQPGATPAQILRDERDTRRAAMTEALVAQMSGVAPTDRARAFMGSSLVEMAAVCVDHRGSLRNVGDKMNVLMAAAHSTSDFSAIYGNALNKVLADRYVAQAPTYRDIARSKVFNDFRPHPVVRVGDFPRLQSVAENGEIKFGSFGERGETAVLAPYAAGLTISRQMLVNDDLGAINDMLADYGAMISDFEEATFYSFALNASLASDGVAVWHASHGNLAGSGTAITVAALAAGKAAMRKQASVDGLKLNIAPTILLVGPDKEVEALQMVTSITPALAGSVNPFSGSLRVVVSAQITGNQWFLFADPSRVPNFCYGYLAGAGTPRVRMEETFGTQGTRVTVEHDFGMGAIDFRGTYRNAGA